MKILDWKTLRAAGLAAAIALAGAGALRAQEEGNEQKPEDLFKSAREAYDVGQYAEAFDAFAQLADGGHCEAARTARQMLRYGRVLYGIEFSVTSERRARWDHLAGCPAPAARLRPLQPGASS